MGGLKFGSVEFAEVRFPLHFRTHEFRPDEGHEPALPDLDRDVVDGSQRPVALGELAQAGAGHQNTRVRLKTRSDTTSARVMMAIWIVATAAMVGSRLHSR